MATNSWQDEHLDAWVRLLDHEEGGDASWMVDVDDESDTRVRDAEGDVIAVASSRAAALSIAFALNHLYDCLAEDEDSPVQLARARAYVRSVVP